MPENHEKFSDTNTLSIFDIVDCDLAVIGKWTLDAENFTSL